MSDDPDESPVTIPITLTIETIPTAIELSTLDSTVPTGIEMADALAVGLLLLAGGVLLWHRR